MGSSIRGSGRHPMGLRATTEPNAVRRVADPRRDDRQQQASRYFHRLCRDRRDDGRLHNSRVRLGASVSRSLLSRRLVNLQYHVARYGKRHSTRRTRRFRARSIESAGRSPHQTRCTSSTTTWISVRAPSSSATCSTHRLPMASLRTSIPYLPPSLFCFGCLTQTFVTSLCGRIIANANECVPLGSGRYANFIIFDWVNIGEILAAVDQLNGLA
jgi:hypothetical protein